MSSALKNSGFKSPKSQNQKIVIFCPADSKKVRILIWDRSCVLLSAEEIDFDPRGKIFRRIALWRASANQRGVTLTEQAMSRLQKYLCRDNAEEAALVKELIWGADIEGSY